MASASFPVPSGELSSMTRMSTSGVAARMASVIGPTFSFSS
jgi:hypothetical protein